MKKSVECNVDVGDEVETDEVSKWSTNLQIKKEKKCKSSFDFANVFLKTFLFGWKKYQASPSNKWQWLNKKT